MTLVRILIAIALSVVLLYFARTNSMGRPEFFSHTENGYTFEMTSVPKAFEGGRVRIPIKITGPIQPDLNLLFRSSKYGQNETTDVVHYGSLPLFVKDSAAGHYYADVATGRKGLKLYYYFEIRDKTGGCRARFMHPEGKPFVLKYIGQVPQFVLIGHITMMAVTVFFATLGFLNAIPLVRGKMNARPLSVCFFLATIAALVGGYVFGVAMNHYAFGTVWEGVPFGTDVTDNKTQNLFVYMLYMFLISIGSFSKGKVGHDLYPPRVLGWFGLAAFVFMLAVYLIPHSIRFSPSLTETVSYSFIGMVVLLYGFGWFRTLKMANETTRTSED
ncbi:MAG: hypothetical protein ACE5K8_02985 [Candidatus Zixiibacteriota bacterium]